MPDRGLMLKPPIDPSCGQFLELAMRACLNFNNRPKWSHTGTRARARQKLCHVFIHIIASAHHFHCNKWGHGLLAESFVFWPADPNSLPSFFYSMASVCLEIFTSNDKDTLDVKKIHKNRLKKGPVRFKKKICMLS